MQVSTTKESLVAPLALVSGAADTRGTVPMLGTVLLKAAGGKLSMLCSDSGVLARALSDCSIKTEGEIAVDVRRFNDLIRAVPDKAPLEISIEDKGSLLIKSGRSRFRLPTLAAADYPRMTQGKDKRITITIAAKRLLDMIDQVALSMADADVRAYLNGMLVSLSDGKLWLVSTDGHRLTVTCEAIEGSEALDKTEVILPRKTALLAKRLLSQGGNVKFTFGTNDAQFTFDDGSVLVGKGIGGIYPDWRRVIPNKNSVSVADAEKVREGLAMVEAIIEDGGKKDSNVRAVEVTFDKALLTIRKGDAARCEIEAESTGAEAVTAGFNIGYLRDALTTIASVSSKVQFGFSDHTSSIAVRPVDGEYPLAVVMPMRL